MNDNIWLSKNIKQLLNTCLTFNKLNYEALWNDDQKNVKTIINHQTISEQ